ncbi:MAG: IPT/TIG domain-containing protein, partial [Candidatus Saganbacteria bacterium]|nr:IPT/TIG domain-containing protein [Candidatus Saganbacteria bacterium]
GLNVETVYYVKVKSKNANGESAYTNAAQFTTLAVATPTNLTVNGIDQNNATPSWYSSDGATGYTVSYGTDPSATNLGTKESTDPWKTLNGLTADTNYYVKVRADNSGKTSSVYTTPVSFKTNALNALGKPTVTIDNISQTQARASWTKVEYADSYLLSVGINPQADSLGTIEVAGLLTDITGLNPGTTYYVKVRAQNASQSGDWSNTVSFTTPSIGTPVITSISPNRGPVNTQITISGSGFGGPADGRCLIFNNVEQRNIPPSSSNIVSWTDTAIVVKIPEWVKGVYKVSVSEKSNYSVSASNDDKTFTIMAVSTLAKTYPNPFNPLKELEKIEFVMTAGANVQVYLYDMTGQPIWKSGTQYFAAGTQTIIWDGITFFSNFAGDGIVMVRVINEDEKTLIAKGKILVIKR